MTPYLTMNLTPILDKNDNEIVNNDNDIDNEIENCISKKGFVRRIQLVKDLMNKHPNERGYSERTINRKIDKMIKLTIILNIESEKELKRYGIQKKDGRAKYLTLKRSTDIKEHLDTVFQLFSSEDYVDQKEALIEIENYSKRYVLDPIQLDVLVQNLDNENTDLIDHLLRILYMYITNKGKEPQKKIVFVDKLKSLLKRYPEPVREYKNLRTHIIHLLGLYNDESVIDQLKIDAGTIQDLDSIENDYVHKFTALIIEKHRSDLFDFKRKLRNEGNDKGAQFIATMRYQALINLGIADNPFISKNSDW